MKVEVDINPEEHTITMNVGEFIVASLNDAGRASLMQDAVVYELAYCEMERLLREESAGPNFNTAIHDMRMRFLESAASPEHVREMVADLLREIGVRDRKIEHERKTARALRKHLRVKYNDHGPFPEYDFSPTAADDDTLVSAVIEAYKEKERTA